MQLPKALRFLETLTQAASPAMNRRDAFGSLGKLATVGIPLAAATLTPGTVRAQTAGTSVVDVLNFALTLEYLEAEFYARGLDADGLLSGDLRDKIALIGEHEDKHVEFLRTAISGAGGTPIQQPLFDFTAGGTFPDVFSNEATFLALAQAFEDTGVRAYKGQAGNLIGNDEVLTAALRIHSVEARHASEIRRIRGSRGWIIRAENTSAPAAAAVYAGEDETTQLGLEVGTVTTASTDQITAAFDEPLSREAVLDIAGLFLA